LTVDIYFPESLISTFDPVAEKKTEFSFGHSIAGWIGA
jgi:hypothetical protein